ASLGGLLLVSAVLCQGFDRVVEGPELVGREIIEALAELWVHQEFGNRELPHVVALFVGHEVLQRLMFASLYCPSQVLNAALNRAPNTQKNIMNPVTIILVNRLDLGAENCLASLLNRS